MSNLTELSCNADDFCQKFIPVWENTCTENSLGKGCRPCQMSYSEIMTILIALHQSDSRNFKIFTRA